MTKLLVLSLITGAIVICGNASYSVNADTITPENTGVYEEVDEEGDEDYEEDPKARLFPDLQNHWAKTLVWWAIGSQFMVGYEDGSFRPDQSITEAEFLKLYYLSYGYPKATSFGEEWTAAPYRMAKMWKHPVTGLQYQVARFTPITRMNAARLVASGLGVNYNEVDSVIYLLGNELLPLPNEPTLAGFRGNVPLTRVEAIEWMRMLKLKGVYTVSPRPEERSERKLLPPLPEQGTGLKDFETFPVSDRDFGIADSGRNLFIDFGSSRGLVEKHYGDSTGQDVFNYEMYNEISVHYDTAGRLDSWKIDTDVEKGGPIRTGTFGNIRPGVSTMADVLKAYGTYVAVSNNYGIVVSYWFENNDGVYEPRLSPFEIENMENGFCIGFGIDKQSLKVESILISTAQQAQYPRD
ncbi:S-layer homology domain-containing protein [Paenibacillus sp. FSL R10-2734]|uniref:S-layer homology domain-containing protein n=1 Tax=Paenibacillus sp. FSL R10-2734 TaxID=2954691 RepID=UPI0030DCC0A6